MKPNEITLLNYKKEEVKKPLNSLMGIIEIRNKIVEQLEGSLLWVV